MHIVTAFSTSIKAKEGKDRTNLSRCRVRPGQKIHRWDNFRNDLKLPVEWKENFDMGKEDFRKLCNKFQP